MPLEFQTALPPHAFGIPTQETPPLPQNSKMPPVVWYGYFLESPICMCALGWHLSVISQSSSHIDIGLLQESDSTFRASTSIPLP